MCLVFLIISVIFVPFKLFLILLCSLFFCLVLGTTYAEVKVQSLDTNAADSYTLPGEFLAVC